MISKPLFLSLLLPLTLLSEPTMPVGFEVAATQPENTTWREYGHLPQTYPMAVAAVKATLEAQGYACAQDIAKDENATQCVMLWEKKNQNGTEKIIVMMWTIEIAKTGCAWGVSDD